MAEFLIHGGKKLEGEIKIAGSKNTAFPLIAAALLTEESVTLKNMPAISDVLVMIEIIRALGAEAEYDASEGFLYLSGKGISSHHIPEELGKKFRASILFSGALVTRLGQAVLPYPGGDKIGARPLTTHLNALRSLGVSVEENEKIILGGKDVKSSNIILEEPSVTATENIILAAVLLRGKTEIHLAAQEPHVQELVKFLNKMGAKICWRGVGILEIEGVKKLGGGEFEINPDELEVSGFSALAAATRSNILIKGIDVQYLDAFFLQLSKMGVEYQVQGENLFIKSSDKDYQAFRIQSGLYPKLASDHLPPFAVLATQARGGSLIHEWLYEGRLKYIEELRKMGAHTRLLDPHRAIIEGPTRLQGTNMISYDIRAGLTVVIAALVASGETRISGIEHIERGYEKFEERLAKLGADIKRI